MPPLAGSSSPRSPPRPDATRSARRARPEGTCATLCGASTALAPPRPPEWRGFWGEAPPFRRARRSPACVALVPLIAHSSSPHTLCVCGMRLRGRGRLCGGRFRGGGFVACSSGGSMCWAGGGLRISPRPPRGSLSRSTVVRTAGASHDAQRDRALAALGHRVLRLDAELVMNDLAAAVALVRGQAQALFSIATRGPQRSAPGKGEEEAGEDTTASGLSLPLRCRDRLTPRACAATDSGDEPPLPGHSGAR